MRSILLVIVFITLSSVVIAQRLHMGVFGGAAAYLGDLTEKIFPKKVTNGAIGVTLNYEVTDNLMLRAGLTYSVVGGADRYSNNADMRLRNLSFETSIIELSTVGEYHFLDLNVSNYSPYIFAGLGIFKFNPYAYDNGGQKQFLKPLSTEGQGINGYADRIPYNLTQFAIPFGGGVKFVVNDDFKIGVEVGLRKLFTDYLDDVSKNYIDPADLLTARGSKALEISYRSDEIGGSAIYPGKSIQRGSPKSKDYYYFAGIHLSYRLGIENNNGGNRSQLGCPKVY